MLDVCVCVWIPFPGSFTPFLIMLPFFFFLAIYGQSSAVYQFSSLSPLPSFLIRFPLALPTPTRVGGVFTKLGKIRVLDTIPIYRESNVENLSHFPPNQQL